MKLLIERSEYDEDIIEITSDDSCNFFCLTSWPFKHGIIRKPFFYGYKHIFNNNWVKVIGFLNFQIEWGYTGPISKVCDDCDKEVCECE